MGIRKKGEGINKTNSLTFFIAHKQTIRFPSKGNTHEKVSRNTSPSILTLFF